MGVGRESHLKCLAAASLAGTSQEANLKHITATWDAVWEVYLDPKWAWQRLRLYGAQNWVLEQYLKKLHVRVKQLVVFFDAAGIGNGGGWGADAVMRACCRVVCWPRGNDQWRVRVVLVDEHRTTRKPREGQVGHRLLRPAWSQQGDQPVRGLTWCSVVAPSKPPQAPCSSQAATQPTASVPGPSTPPPAKRSKAEQGLQCSTKHAAHWGGQVAPTAGGQTRQLCQPRARSTLSWAKSGCETGHPRPSSSLLWHSSGTLSSCHQLTISACTSCPLYGLMRDEGADAHPQLMC
ncbi:hypothetical protein HaLaN_15864 [Haematococcus lacustris]|uniref:Uncharacterized protein n=1 Tax=Haematococcus lacustris TaxID=44745 RepID=A0A699ZC39_HAELA|nr:hypothetical protein HaLaN_15864 [Haematococcus lacustris]